MKTLKNIILSAVAVVLMAVPLAMPVMASAATGGAEVKTGLCAGVQLDATATTCDPTLEQTSKDKVNSIITTIINIFSFVVGVVAVIMIIIGGFKYITSGGDSGNVTGAKNTILYAIIGLAIVAMAQFITRFVLTKLGVS